MHKYFAKDKVPKVAVQSIRLDGSNVLLSDLMATRITSKYFYSLIESSGHFLTLIAKDPQIHEHEYAMHRCRPGQLSRGLNSSTVALMQ
jgi:hypothetical protein